MRRLLGEAGAKVVDTGPQSVRRRKESAQPPTPPPPPGDRRPTCPTHLRRLVGVEPPSLVIDMIQDAQYGRLPTAAQREQWPTVSNMPWPTAPVSTLVACIGRRGLKSSGIIAWSAVYEAIAGGHEAYAMPGGRIYFVIIAPEQRQSRETVRGVEAALQACRSLGVTYTRKDPSGATELTLQGPGPCQCERVISIMTADNVSVRGFAVAFLALDEGGFLPSEAHLVVRDADILGAVTPGMTQFPAAKMIWASTPGPSQGEFFNAVQNPPEDSLLVRCPSWVANHRITEAACRKRARDARHFEQEYQAGRFGALDESFIDEDSVRACIDEPACSQGPREGSFCAGLDVGLVHDATALAVASCHYVDVPGSSPIVHVILEHVEEWRGSRAKPLELPTLLDRVSGTTRAFRRARVYHDAHEGSETDRGLRERGCVGEVVAMTPAAQTERFSLLADLIHSRRLHIPNHPELVKQLSGLRCTQLSSGFLRVQAAGNRHDDLADAVALAVERAVKLNPTGGAIGFEYAAVHFTGAGDLTGGEKRWYREFANGNRDYNIEPPVGSKEWRQHVDNCVATGVMTPAVERWLREQAEWQGQAAVGKAPPTSAEVEFRKRVEEIRAKSIGS